MTVSSRTPEGLPSRCPLCGAQTRLQYSDPAGDAPCPNCGCLLWLSTRMRATLQQNLSAYLGVLPEKISAQTSFVQDLGAESLDLVEFVMELEEAYDLSIPELDAEQFSTLGDVIRYLQTHGREDG